MLIYRRTSLLESSAQTLVNTVNCVGVMGKGLAHAFKEREPRMFDAYKSICERGVLAPGKLWLWRGANNWVLNFPTKMHWRNPSKIEWIEAGLEKFVSAHAEQGIREISFPLLGCGNGGLEWETVRPVMERYLKGLSIPVYIHDYTVDIGLPEHMERIAQELAAKASAERSFDAFMTALRSAIDMTGDRLTGLRTDRTFQARMGADDAVVIADSNRHWTFESEALRDIWIGLTNGIVRPAKADRAAGGGGGASLLSLMSVLPQIRPIEIAPANSAAAEIAVELKPSTRGVIDVPDPAMQRELAWH